VSGAAGWYPDPGGEPDRYRYWDGVSWSVETAADPGGDAPDSMTAARPAPRPRVARWMVVTTIVAVLVAVVAVSGRIWNEPDRPAVLPDPSASAGASTQTSGIDDGSPPPSAPTPTPVARNIGCPEGAPDARSPHPADDRVYGGTLSFLRAPGFAQESSENRLTFAYDVSQQVRTVSRNPPWIAQLAVGRLLADGYPRDAQHAAEFVAECIVASDLYLPYDPVRRDVSSRPIQISGQDGWQLVTDVDVTLTGLTFPGDQVTVIVVPDGSDWGLFFGAVPIGDQALDSVLSSTVSSLRIS
jgi:hypothetical protein